jgi:hypothetical protein
MTNERFGLSPTARITRAGAIVIRCRRNSGIRRLMNPCITTCPAIVPTEQLERPLACRPTPKRIA